MIVADWMFPLECQRNIYLLTFSTGLFDILDASRLSYAIFIQTYSQNAPQIQAANSIFSYSYSPDRNSERPIGFDHTDLFMAKSLG